MRTLDDVTTQSCHSERREESVFETLHFVQGDNSGVPIFCSLV
jgi:hypothetical protein